MQHEVIPDSSISASTELSNVLQARNARLHFQGGPGRIGAWTPYVSNRFQWLQVNFGNWSKVAGVAIQGKHAVAEWVKSFTISYSYGGVLFVDYRENDTNKVMVTSCIDIFVIVQ